MSCDARMKQLLLGGRGHKEDLWAGQRAAAQVARTNVNLDDVTPILSRSFIKILCKYLVLYNYCIVHTTPFMVKRNKFVKMEERDRSTDIKH